MQGVGGEGEAQDVNDRAWALYRERQHNRGDIERRGWFDDRLWSACVKQAQAEAKLRGDTPCP